MRDREGLDVDAGEVEGRAGVRSAQTGCWAPGDTWPCPTTLWAESLRLR